MVAESRFRWCYFLGGRDIDPTGFAKLRHVTISLHVTSSFFSIDWFELRSEVFLPAACLEVFEVSYVAGKYLVLKYAHNAYNLTRRYNPNWPQPFTSSLWVSVRFDNVQSL